MANIIGINSKAMDNAVDEISNNLEIISKTFYKMEDLICNSNSYVTEDIGNSLRASFNKISSNFPTVKENIETYIVELQNCKNNYEKQDSESSILFQDRIN